MAKPPAGPLPTATMADLDSDRPLRAPAAAPRGKPRLPPQGGTATVRDSLRNDQGRRLERARKQRARALASNPFLDDEAPLIPGAPPDDEQWAYAWKRRTIQGQEDLSNLQKALNGRLRWEIVTMQDLPEADRTRLALFSGIEGRFNGAICFSDLVLMRTDRRMRDMKIEAEHIRAEQRVRAIRRQFLEADGADELGTFVESDQEAVFDARRLNDAGDEPTGYEDDD